MGDSGVAIDRRRSSIINTKQKNRGTPHSQRVKTAIRSFRVLRGLTPAQVDAFLASYTIYSLDWSDEKTMVDTLGPDYQQKVGACLSDYYGVLNHLCAIGDLEKMYIPPAMDLSQSIVQNQILYEESIVDHLRLPPNAKVLDLGCGRGRVAAHISTLTGASVTGLNIDADQIASAKTYTATHHLPNTFQTHDFNILPLPFSSASFDGFYQIQAFSLCADLPALCSELYRILRPGARLSLLDWASLPAYDASNPEHIKLMTRIKPLIGAVGTPTPASLTLALEGAGFRMVKSENVSIDGLQAPLIEKADGTFCAVKRIVEGAVKVGLLPAHFKTLLERLTKDCDAFVEADRRRLVTTSWCWVAEKVEEGDGKGRSVGSSEKSEKSVDGSGSGSEESGKSGGSSGSETVRLVVDNAENDGAVAR
ncbi:unnamed protein product [Zymoseptoria tritici ST99CH_1A5]|uniref:Methyltransferase type 11 domain-containing protein n=1 Tax=Zymoseptoria tritici ST99CH_1A5 TaxID=1276529 RepID=A0A1Y6L935_ZYMTR|nr:unnamed protein product [Zymoseptoria tritici ST99CH_3D1]SMY20129.1 unnamed protein product [Zymoseptoria tritici ST99CH_1A5]